MIWSKENRYSTIHTYYTHKSDVNSLCYSPCGNFLASGSSDKTIFIHDVNNYEYSQEAFARESCAVYQVMYSPCGRLLASVGEDKIIRIRVIETKEVFRSFAGHKLRVNSILFLPSGKHLISGSDDKNIRIWDIEDQKEAERLDSHLGGVTCLPLSQLGSISAQQALTKQLKCGNSETSFYPHLSSLDFW
mmetsp:Transcript_20040/g.20091  ORF Transcript_20040/g.20091 Transcript_20040/m.20091 type:complete len:190 (+) Transcript_20040:424-993(+)